MCKTKGDLRGKVAIVTGGGSGLGLETSRRLSRRGAKVIIASRNEDKLEHAKEMIQNETGNPVEYMKLDLGSFKSIREFTRNTIENNDHVDILVNNVGAFGLPDKFTEDGLNLMMQVNYFGMFLLTYLLVPLLQSSKGRVVNISASSMYIGNLDFDHLNDVGRYSSLELLSNSKLAGAVVTAEFADRLQNSGVIFSSYDPFLVSDTNILGNVPTVLRIFGEKFLFLIGRPKEDVADELVFLASDPSIRQSGNHYKFCGKWPRISLANNKKVRQKLWMYSKKLVHIKPSEVWD